MFIALIVLMVSQLYAYVQTYQIVYFKYVQFFVYQLYLNKVENNLNVKELRMRPGK